jgi:fructose-bisphosphate aldolase class I
MNTLAATNHYKHHRFPREQQRKENTIMGIHELPIIARSLVAENKGILAADESSSTIKRRFESIGFESTEENRRAYREMLFTTPGIEAFLSGIILFDETIRQMTANGRPFPELLAQRGIIPGIKVDKGTADLSGFPEEKITEGLDGLASRLVEYQNLGARFAKWRAVISIGPGIPTQQGIEVNAHVLARYASLCQTAGLVPIVEPEVLMDGDHTIDRCEEVTEAVLGTVFTALCKHRVLLEGILLKPNMVISGKACPVQAGPELVAWQTLRCFSRTVPAAVPGVVFLSGGQTPKQATENLHAMNARGAQPWQLSFSYGRALQDEALKIWKGDSANNLMAQQAFYRRATCVSAARQGKYVPSMEVLAD